MPLENGKFIQASLFFMPGTRDMDIRDWTGGVLSTLSDCAHDDNDSLPCNPCKSYSMAQNLHGQRHDRTALILYGSETGNSQDVAEELGCMTEKLHFVTRVCEMDLVEISLLSQFSVVIFAISTTGQGEFPKNARKFWKSLLRKRLPPGCLDHVVFTTFGLGDSSYPRYNFAARKLHKRLEQLGAKEVYPRGEGDEQHDEGIDGTFLSWSFGLRTNLLSLFPLPEGVEPIPLEVLLPPKFRLEISDDNEDATKHPMQISKSRDEDSAQVTEPALNASRPEEFLPGNFNQELIVTRVDMLKNDDNNLQPREQYPANPIMNHEPPPEPEVAVPCPQIKEPHAVEDVLVDHHLPLRKNIILQEGYDVKLFSNIRVTPETHWQDVRQLTFIMSDEFDYEPGDTMTIFPKNFPADVNSLIELQGWHDVADRPLRLAPEHPHYYSDKYLMDLIPPGLHFPKNGTLRDLLSFSLDFTAIPKRHFFGVIAHHTDDAMHKERLLEFANPIFTDELYDYTTRPRRSILEVLQDFPSVKLPWKWICGIFPPIRGRKYSICSGGILRTYKKDYIKVQILVAIVKYRTVLKKIRQGLCSRYLASLQVGTPLRVDIESSGVFSKLAIYKEPWRPCIFIAPGTGIAPCRSLIWERASKRADQTKVDVGDNYLFFGGRNKDADYFYKEDWTHLSLATTVFTAFSRDQKEKIYVQDIIREQGMLLANLLTSAIEPIIFVCGSSGNMPKAVRAALVDVLLTYSKEYKERGRDWVEKELEWREKNGSYIQETW